MRYTASTNEKTKPHNHPYRCRIYKTYKIQHPFMTIILIKVSIEEIYLNKKVFTHSQQTCKIIFIFKQKLYETLFTCWWSNVIAKVVNCTEIVELLMAISPTLGAGVISKGTGREAWFLHVSLIQQLKWTSEKRFREWKLETLKHEKHH